METKLAFPRALLDRSSCTSDSQEEKDYLPVSEHTSQHAETPEVSAKTTADLLCNIWQIYSTLVQDEGLWKIINEPRDEGSDVFYLQRVIVQTADLMGRALAGPPTVIDELKALMDTFTEQTVSVPVLARQDEQDEEELQ